MKTQLNQIPKTKIHFGNTSDGQALTPQQQEIADMRRIHNNLINDELKKFQHNDISYRTFKKETKRIRKEMNTHIDYFTNQVDSNLNPIVKVAEAKENFFGRLFKLFKSI